jgi:hypothetical protein
VEPVEHDPRLLRGACTGAQRAIRPYLDDGKEQKLTFTCMRHMEGDRKQVIDNITFEDR